MKFLLSTVLLLCFLPLSLLAQAPVVPLWQQHIPGAIDNPAYREDTLKLDGSQIRIYRVSLPTLQIFNGPVENKTKTAIIIAPGGGYTRLAMDNEGSATATWLNSLGITAIILKYRLPNDSIMTKKEIGPLEDAQEAIRYVRRNSAQLGIDPDKIGIMGFSAGGHLAATVSTHYALETYPHDSVSARPDFCILGYPVISMDTQFAHGGSRKNLLGNQPSQELVDFFSAEKQITKDTPPTFLFLAADDKSVPVQNSILYFQALLKQGIPAELHLFQSGGHGFGMGKGGTESQWPALCSKWLKLRGYVK